VIFLWLTNSYNKLLLFSFIFCSISTFVFPFLNSPPIFILFFHLWIDFFCLLPFHSSNGGCFTPHMVVQLLLGLFSSSHVCSFILMIIFISSHGFGQFFLWLLGFFHIFLSSFNDFVRFFSW